MPRPPLLLDLDSARSPRRASVGATLAALAERAGVGFECYYDDFRAGRHFGGGDPRSARPGWPAGTPVAGGRHADHALRLAAVYDVAALGDPDCVLWPALEAARVEVLARTVDPAALYTAAFEHLGQPLPARALVLDGEPQGRGGLVPAPYLYPALLAGDPVVAVDATGGHELRGALEARGVTWFEGLYVDPARAAAFPGAWTTARATWRGTPTLRSLGSSPSATPPGAAECSSAIQTWSRPSSHAHAGWRSSRSMVGRRPT